MATQRISLDLSNDDLPNIWDLCENNYYFSINNQNNTVPIQNHLLLDLKLDTNKSMIDKGNNTKWDGTTHKTYENISNILYGILVDTTITNNRLPRVYTKDSNKNYHTITPTPAFNTIEVATPTTPTKTIKIVKTGTTASVQLPTNANADILYCNLVSLFEAVVTYPSLIDALLTGKEEKLMAIINDIKNYRPETAHYSIEDTQPSVGSSFNTVHTSGTLLKKAELLNHTKIISLTLPGDTVLSKYIDNTDVKDNFVRTMIDDYTILGGVPDVEQITASIVLLFSKHSQYNFTDPQKYIPITLLAAIICAP